jgi:hypothetical protein
MTAVADRQRLDPDGSEDLTRRPKPQSMALRPVRRFRR